MLLDTGCHLYIRDVTQAYIQSTTTLNRDFYVKPPKELELPPGCLLQVVKPLYGIPEAGNHWFETYHTHHRERLNMKPSPYDNCLLHCKDPDYGFGIIGMQTDDTLILADDKFADQEEQAIADADILCKPRSKLTATTPLRFNGAMISFTESCQGIVLTQERTLSHIQLVKMSNADMTNSRGKVRKNLTPQEQYVSQRALGAYVATLSQPEAAFDLSFAAQTTKPTKSDIDALNKRLEWQFNNQNRGLRYVPIDIKTAKLMVFADASFAGNKDLSSQIGYVIVLADDNNTANILHWSSTKCKRVTRSVLAAELYALVNAFDIAAVIRDTVDELLHLEHRIPLVACTDSKSLYNCIVKLDTTQEKRLMIDLAILREAFEHWVINEVRWIDGNSNPADAMTKSKPGPALKSLIDTNKLDIRVQAWTEHSKP